MRLLTVQRVLAVVYVLVLAGVALWPTPVDANLDVLNSWPVRTVSSVTGIDSFEVYRGVEFGANVVLFVPLGWFAMTLLGLRWWQAVLVGIAVTMAAEVGQALMRPDRFATLGDVVANTAGAVLGVAAAMLVGRSRRAEVRGA